MKSIGIVCCSNGQKLSYMPKLRCLEDTLLSIGIKPIFSDCIYEKEDVFSGTAKMRANELMKFYKDDDIEGIFDISGGDISNGILPYLDYEVIANSNKMFFGYSDLTTVINAIYKKTGKSSCLYQIRNLIYEYKEEQINSFKNTFLENNKDLYKINYKFIQQNTMEGIVVGGNIRCFLKLAGTEYIPDLNGKILLLEACSGTAAKIETYLCQLKQIGAFEKVSGILLGTFTEMEEKNYYPTVDILIKNLVDKDMPIAVTKDIGHGKDAKGILIGKRLKL